MVSEFVGNYEDSSWKEFDFGLRKEAWNIGFIDARLFCERVCGQIPTGANKDRRSRTGYGQWQGGSAKRPYSGAW